VQAFGWSLHDLDRTHVESLFPFIRRFGSQVEEKKKGKLVYADDPAASWL
jgi:hypothetical protein